MKLLEELGINTKESFLCLLGSNANVGKTTSLCIIAANYVNEGDKVLFISDSNVRGVSDKFLNLSVSNTNNGRLVIKNITIMDKPLKESINYKEFTHVFIDCPIVNIKNENFLEEARNLVNEGITIFISSQLRKTIGELGHKVEINNFPKLNNVHMSDYVIVLSKQVNLTFFEKIKFFFFPKKKPNLTFKLLKNRFGKLKEIKKFIQFKTVNKF